MAHPLKVGVLTSLNDTLEIGACWSRRQCRARPSSHLQLQFFFFPGSLQMKSVQFSSQLKVVKKSFFSFMCSNWLDIRRSYLSWCHAHDTSAWGFFMRLVYVLQRPQTSALSFYLLMQSYTNILQEYLCMNIMFWARNFAHVQRRNEIFSILSHLGRWGSNVLELFFLPIEGELCQWKSRAACKANGNSTIRVWMT